MHVSFRHITVFVAGVVVWFAPLVNHKADAQTVTANARANAVASLTPEQIKGLQQRFSLSNQEIDRLPEATLQTMLWQLAHPNVDLHAAANRFRLLKLRDENGQIPTNAWLGAAQQRAQIVSHSRPA